MPRLKPEYYKKILLKTIDGSKITWVHFCYVPLEIWKEFHDATGSDNIDMGGWIAKWAKDEFDLSLKMAKRKDINILRTAIKIAYADRYYELYSPTLGHAALSMHGVIKNWVAIHMKMEAAKYGSNKRGDGRDS